MSSTINNNDNNNWLNLRLQSSTVVIIPLKSQKEGVQFGLLSIVRE